MERKPQRKITKTLKEFYKENYLVPVISGNNKKQEISTEERLLKLFANLINLYKALRIVSKEDETAAYAIQSLKPIFKLLNSGIRKNGFNLIDFSKYNSSQIKQKIKALAASINIGLHALFSFYSMTDNDRMKTILDKACDKFTTSNSIIEKL